MTHFAQEMTFRIVVFIQIDFKSIIVMAFAIIINVIFRYVANWLDSFIIILIVPLEIDYIILIMLRLNVENKKKFTNLKFLIFR